METLVNLSWKGRDPLRARLFSDVKLGAPVMEAFRAEHHWRVTRDALIKGAQPVCQMCGYAKNLEVHHALPWHTFPELRYRQDNLMTLCSACHFRFGHHQNWKTFNISIFRLAHQTQSMLKHIVNWGAFKNDQKFLDSILGNDNT